MRKRDYIKGRSIPAYRGKQCQRNDRMNAQSEQLNAFLLAPRHPALDKRNRLHNIIKFMHETAALEANT